MTKDEKIGFAITCNICGSTNCNITTEQYYGDPVVQCQDCDQESCISITYDKEKND